MAELDAKAKQLETELDLTAEKLGYVSLQASIIMLTSSDVVKNANL